MLRRMDATEDGCRRVRVQHGDQKNEHGGATREKNDVQAPCVLKVAVRPCVIHSRFLLQPLTQAHLRGGMTRQAVRERHAPPLCVPGEAVGCMRAPVVLEALAVVQERQSPLCGRLHERG